MTTAIRVLLVEDCEDDALLVMRALKQGGFDAHATRVHDLQALESALAQRWDVVLSDFSLQGFNGMQALLLCRRVRGDIPFILVSGTVGEEMAVAVMKAGANDYVMKHGLSRLAPALRRELQDADARASLRSTEMQLFESEKRFQAFMDASPFVASIKDADGAYMYMNTKWSTVHGADGARCSGSGTRSGDSMQAPALTDLQVTLGADTIESIEERSQADGSVAYWKNTRFPFFGAAGQRLLGALSSDVTALRQSQETIRTLAFLDPLTGLANRRLMHDRLGHALALAARSGQHGALLFLDLDNFKHLNDSLGHNAGDQILVQVGARLLGCMREHDTVARAGGDEFVIILEQLDRAVDIAAEQADRIGRELIDMFKTPFLLDGASASITVSIGMVMFSSVDHRHDELMKRADIALYKAKSCGRNQHMRFDPAMQARVDLRSELVADLRTGMELEQFVLYYQPQVDSQGRTSGFEALLRLHHPVKGLVMPSDFIALAEETGLIFDLGYWTIASACSQLRAWAAGAATSRLPIAVNVSARQFNDAGFVERVRDIVDHSGADPNLLMLELTESLLLDEVDSTIGKMVALRACGIRFSLDDFGTGFSSLSYLKRLPLSEIKIDRSFVQNLIDDANDAVIVRAIIGLARSFGLSTIAEGVETQAQQNFLRAIGCDRFQGYLFGRAEPAEIVTAALIRKN